MFIKMPHNDYSCRVLAIYYDRMQRIYMVYPEKGYNGISAVGEEDNGPLVTDPKVEDMVLVKSGIGEDIFLNQYIYDAGIYEGMVEHETEEMENFHELCRLNNIELFRYLD